MLEKIPGDPHTKIGEKLHITICPQTVFEVQPSRSPDLKSLHVFLWGHLKSVVHSAPTEKKGHFTNAFFMSEKPFATAAGNLKGCEIQHQTCPYEH